MKKLLKKCWENRAVRNVGNVLVSVVLSVVLVNNGFSVDDAKQITGAVGAVIGGILWVGSSIIKVSETVTVHEWRINTLESVKK